jgi:maltodextrin utilization protein YvdJ
MLVLLFKTKKREKMKIIIAFLLACTISFAKTDYSEMSTQELIAIMGYVKKSEQNKFYNELRSRIPTMNEKEKKEYLKNKKKQNK